MAPPETFPDDIKWANMKVGDLPPFLDQREVQLLMKHFPQIDRSSLQAICSVTARAVDHWLAGRRRMSAAPIVAVAMYVGTDKFFDFYDKLEEQE